MRLRLIATTATVVAAAFGIASSAPGAEPPTVGAVTSPTTVSIGDSVTITGFVENGAGRIPGIDVTVKLYTLPNCASGPSPRTVLTTDANGTFTFTETLTVNPPVSYGFLVGLSQDPTRAPDFGNRDQCVNLNAAAKLSAKAEGSVTVGGSEFKSGVISYGSTIDLAAGSAVKLSTDVGSFRFFPVAGQSSSFMPTRVALPTPKGKKKQFIIELRLVGDFTNCKNGKKTNGYRTEAATKKPPPSLWGKGKGHYRTRGRYSSATVLGTNWLVVDQCGGTLTVVRSGVVRVRDFAKNKTVTLHAGQRYLARPR